MIQKSTVDVQLKGFSPVRSMFPTTPSVDLNLDESSST